MVALITEDELGARRDGIENAADLVAYELAFEALDQTAQWHTCSRREGLSRCLKTSTVGDRRRSRLSRRRPTSTRGPLSRGRGPAGAAALLVQAQRPDYFVVSSCPNTSSPLAGVLLGAIVD